MILLLSFSSAFLGNLLWQNVHYSKAVVGQYNVPEIIAINNIIVILRPFYATVKMLIVYNSGNASFQEQLTLRPVE